MTRRRHPATIASERQHQSAAMSKEAAFHEVKHNPPAIVKQTARKEGKTQARKQAVAIALSKAGLSRRK